MLKVMCAFFFQLLLPLLQRAPFTLQVTGKTLTGQFMANLQPPVQPRVQKPRVSL